MSVVCIDFGNENCYMAQIKPGGVENIVNEYGNRATPSWVAFSKNNRLIGDSAKNHQGLNIENTIRGFKHMLGNKFAGKYSNQELNKLCYPFFTFKKEFDIGDFGVNVEYHGEKSFFLPEQIVAMLFSKLKSNIKNDQVDVVLTVPTYFTSSERQVLLDCASIAGLNSVFLLNELTAIGLNYCYYKQDQLPYQGRKLKYVAFIDFGHTSLQMSIVAFTKGKMKVFATASTMIGGRDFDKLLADHFCKVFNQKYHKNPLRFKKIYAILLVEVEKLKKLMSINKTNLKFKINDFMGQPKFESVMCRADMEKICSKLFFKLEDTILKCVARSKININLIHSVEITGGSSRIPKFKLLIEEIFGKQPSTTLNQDETVSRGGAIYCSMMSKFVQLKDEIEIIDVLPINHPIHVGLEYNNSINKTLIFDGITQFPITRKIAMVELKDKVLPNTLYFSYADQPFTLDSWILKWNKEEQENCNNAIKLALKLTLSIDHNGILTLNSVNLEMEKQALVEISPYLLNTTINRSKSAALTKIFSGGLKRGRPKKNAKISIKVEIVRYPYTCEVDFKLKSSKLSFEMIEYYRMCEIQMIQNDDRESQRSNTRNKLEELILKTRDNVSFNRNNKLTTKVAEKFRTDLSHIEKVLKISGEDMNTKTFVQIQDAIIEMVNCFQKNKNGFKGYRNYQIKKKYDSFANKIHKIYSFI